MGFPVNERLAEGLAVLGPVVDFQKVRKCLAVYQGATKAATPTMQWQGSILPTGPWTNIAGATATYNNAAQPAAATGAWLGVELTAQALNAVHASYRYGQVVASGGVGVPALIGAAGPEEPIAGFSDPGYQTLSYSMGPNPVGPTQTVGAGNAQ
jgi:hypothetical protein